MERSTFYMAESTLSMAIFNSKLLVYQMGNHKYHINMAIYIYIHIITYICLHTCIINHSHVNWFMHFLPIEFPMVSTRSQEDWKELLVSLDSEAHPKRWLDAMTP